MNPNSLILSTDGAVTVKGRKTFTGVKKLLEISCNPPIVAMYYGKPDFGLVEMESIIEEFKKQYDFNNLNSVKKISSALIDFLSKFTYGDDVDYFVKYYLTLFKKELKQNLENMDEKIFWDYIDSFEKIDTFSFIQNISFDDVIPDCIHDRSDANDVLLEIFSYQLANSGTGLVIAGFDNDCNRPSFIHLGLMVNNKGTIEYEVLDFEENYDNTGIISFAQDREINTFIRGIDLDLELSIVNYINLSLDFYLDDFYEILAESSEFDEDNLKKIEFFKNQHKNDFSYANMFYEQLQLWKDDNYESFLEIIPFLPKHLLAELARFLILIVSSKRKFSFDLDSVGGQIDVCVVTKNKIEF